MGAPREAVWRGSLVLVSTEKEGTLRDGVGDVGSAGNAVTGGDGNT